MLLHLPCGSHIAVSPFRFWDNWRSKTPLLTIRSGQVFHPAHATTRLCLELLSHELRQRPNPSVIDVGCGTGILALTAARLGAPIAVGFDIDSRAVRVSRENARSNGLERETHWLVGSTQAVRGCFDLVLANLPCPVIMDLAAELARLLKPQGRMILSGFQDVHWYTVTERLAQQGLEVGEPRSADLSFYGIPPSGSFTWMVVPVRHRQPAEPSLK